MQVISYVVSRKTTETGVICRKTYSNHRQNFTQHPPYLYIGFKPLRNLWQDKSVHHPRSETNEGEWSITWSFRNRYDLLLRKHRYQFCLIILYKKYDTFQDSLI